MLNKISKILSGMVVCALVALPNDLKASDCGCADTPSGYNYTKGTAYNPEVISPVVKNYDCSGNAPVYTPEPVAYQTPVQPQRFSRPAPQRVEYVAKVPNREARLKPLSDYEVSNRGYRTATVQKVRKPAPKKANPEFLMSSRSERQRVFENAEDKPCRDGSIFGGGPCKSKDKNGSIFGGGPCKNCSKNGSIFGGGSCKTCAKKGSILESGPCKTCSKNGSIFGGGSCKNCKKPCASCQKPKACPCQQPAPQPLPCACKQPSPVPCTCKQPAPLPAPQPLPCACKQTSPVPCACEQPVVQPAPRPTCVKKYELQEVVRDCSAFAPFSLEWVDFRIIRGDERSFSRNLGNYRFRIFGCRRNAKNAILNEGRLMEKDMNFNEIFTDMVSDCYKIVSTQKCIDENTVLPEYVLTAEITDYAMDLCDEYNWDEARMSGNRNGTSEISVTWRLMDASKTNVLWKGETKGYAELQEGDQNGEMVLVQRAFADAADNLRYMPGFEDQLAVRVDKSELEQQRRILMEAQRASGICEVKVVEDSGVVSTGFGAREAWIEVTQTPMPVVIPVKEVKTPEVEVAIVTPEPQPEVIVKTAVIAPEPIVETPKPEPVVAGALYEADKICIVERVDIEGVETPCMIRNSVVSITNAQGLKGAGLLISDQFIMTSADLIDRSHNKYTINTINGKELSAKAFRVNPRRNTALLVLSDKIEYTPLALANELPAVGKGSYTALGLNSFTESNSQDNISTVSSYRYAEDGTAEIMTGSYAQGVSMGAVLVDEKCRVAGIAHHRKLNTADLFLPMETAMKSLGVEICGKAFPEIKPEPKPQPKAWRKPVSVYIDNPTAKTPEAMPAKLRK
ncbi:MAG: hypothetical protein IJ689_06830 [Alphaproteobacteria bacterium]|nr:hypothetical protein [Alphaproteobacteria bacterium]